jgi:hypothetical protein
VVDAVVRISLLLALSTGLILTGIALVLAGAPTSGSRGGCFFWPFPLIIVCGLGTGGSVYVPIIFGAVALMTMLLFSMFWARKAAQGFAKADEHLDDE